MAVFGSMCWYNGGVFIGHWMTMDASQWDFVRKLSHKDPCLLFLPRNQESGSHLLLLGRIEKADTQIIFYISFLRS